MKILRHLRSLFKSIEKSAFFPYRLVMRSSRINGTKAQGIYLSSLFYPARRKAK